MRMACDLCGCADLRKIYIPLGRRGDESVTICPVCSLVQTLPRPRKSREKAPRLSFGADFGNLRYHKGLMNERAVAFLRRGIPPGEVEAVLDVGANRGYLVRALRDWLPRASIVAVEPDPRVVGWEREARGIRLLGGRFEDVDLCGERFDLVTCFHTLEHVDAPRAFLGRLRRSLSARGRLFLEVPDLACIAETGIVEEFFIDKHLYHFSRAVLEAYLAVAGLRAIAWSDGDDSSLTVLAEPAPSCTCVGEVLAELRLSAEVAPAVAAIEEYGRRLARNLTAIRGIGGFIERNADRRILLWGAGRIFSAAVAAGIPLDGPVVGLVDSHVAQDCVAGLRVLRPEEARPLAPDYVIVFSRDYFDQISREARAIFGESVGVVGYEQLMPGGGDYPAATA